MSQSSDRRQATSGSRAGAQFWVEEKDNFGMRMMQKQGWVEGKGLGKKEDGTKSYLRAKFKGDARGIGATNDQEEATWTATQDLYTDLLKRLKTDNSTTSASPSPTPMEESVEVSESTTTTTSGNSTTTLKNFIAKRTLYGRFKRSKDVSNYSSTAMSEIFGRKPTTPTNATAASSASNGVKSEAEAAAEIKVKREANPDHELLQTSKVSIRDYFAAKLAAAGKLGSMSASEFASGGINKPEPSPAAASPSSSSMSSFVKAEPASDQRGFTMSQQEDYYNKMMMSAISGAGVQTGQRAKVGLGFGGAGTGGNTGVKSYGQSELYNNRRSMKIEDTEMRDSTLPEHHRGPASSPVAAYEEESQDAAAVDAAPHKSSTDAHSTMTEKERRKQEKKEKKKRKREEEAEEEKADENKHTNGHTNGNGVTAATASDEKSEKKAKKKAKKEAEAAAAEAEAKAKAAAAEAEAEAERKRKKKEKKAAKKTKKEGKKSSDSD